MRSNQKSSRPGISQNWHLKNRENEVEIKVGRPGSPQTWHLKNRGNEVQRKVGRPGTPQTWHLKIGEYEGQQKNWHTNYSPDLTLQISQSVVFIYPFGTPLLRHTLKCAEIGLHVHSHEENIECRSVIFSALAYHRDMIFFINIFSWFCGYFDILVMELTMSSNDL